MNQGGDRDRRRSANQQPSRVRRRGLRSRTGAVALACAALVACGDDTSTTDTSGDTSSPATTLPATTTSQPQGLEQLAIWPAADVVFATPESAAADFVREVLRVPPTLGDFQAGDARSGEIVVFSPGEGDSGRRVPRGVLLLRQLGPDSGWFVVGAVNDNATITTPAPSATVEAGPLTVSGVGRGFEATVIVTALIAGSAGPPLDDEITSGGSMETPEPFTVSLDLSAAEPGEAVMLLVRGGVGLETDPGDFGAIPVRVASGS